VKERTRREERQDEKRERARKTRNDPFLIIAHPIGNTFFFSCLLGFKHIYVETKNAWIYSSVRPSEVCESFSKNVPKINKKSDFYDMNTKYPFHRVKLRAFPKNVSSSHTIKPELTTTSD
jgi:hypothetical protein